MFCVAPLTGSVDRNRLVIVHVADNHRVAPLTGSVDRNSFSSVSTKNGYTSLPSRGAWIEITIHYEAGFRILSLPSRGAWIEMAMLSFTPAIIPVAPLTGSVDRNQHAGIEADAPRRRSPHGERG